MIDGNSILHAMEAVIYNKISDRYDQEIINKCRYALCRCLYLNFKSRLMYVPKTRKQALNDNYDIIFNEFNGHNHKELAIKYRRSEQWVYALIKRRMRAHIQRHQHDLFPVAAADEQKKHITVMVIEDYLPTEFTECGVDIEDALTLCQFLSSDLCARFPGISVSISRSMVRARDNGGQGDVFG